MAGQVNEAKHASVLGRGWGLSSPSGRIIAREVDDIESTGYNRPGELKDKLGVVGRSGHPTSCHDDYDKPATS